MQEYLNIAVRAAQKAGVLLRENWGGSFAIEKKGVIDLVTEVDKQAEKVIIREILAAFPTHGILAEESGLSKQQSDFLWIIDPLDGTTNFAHAYPCFCTSIGLEINRKLSVGVVYNPLLDEMFTAVTGQGAFRNNQRLQVSKTSDLNNSLICTGFAYDVRKNRVNNLKQFNDFILKAQGVRRDGSAALDIANIACGRFDGFWEFNLNPWDMAAGVLLIQEAGGKVSNIDGSPFDLRAKNVLASNGVIHELMLQVLKDSVSETHSEDVSGSGTKGE